MARQYDETDALIISVLKQMGRDAALKRKYKTIEELLRMDVKSELQRLSEQIDKALDIGDAVLFEKLSMQYKLLKT